LLRGLRLDSTALVASSISPWGIVSIGPVPIHTRTPRFYAIGPFPYKTRRAAYSTARHISLLRSTLILLS
jgi:hypothetical protein